MIQDILSLAHAAGHVDREPLVAREGIAVGGSYDPKSGTIEVIFGDTAANLGNDIDAVVTHNRVPLVTMHLGDQYGPVGNERVILIPTQAGYCAVLYHHEDDSPRALAGERWITHRNAQGVVDASIRFTNDGQSSDKKGGLALLGGSQLTLGTGSGFAVTLDDADKRFTITTPGGMQVTLSDASKLVELVTTGGNRLTLDDAARSVVAQTAGGQSLALADASGSATLTTAGGQTITATASTILVGAGSLDPTLDAAVTVRQLQSWIAAYDAHTHTDIARGSSNSGPPTNTASVVGSATVRIAP